MDNIQMPMALQPTGDDLLSRLIKFTQLVIIFPILAETIGLLC